MVIAKNILSGGAGRCSGGACSQDTSASSVLRLTGLWAAGSSHCGKLCEHLKTLRFGSLNLGTIRKMEGEVVETLTRRWINHCAVCYCGICKTQNRMLTGKDSCYRVLLDRQQRGKGQCRHPTGWMLGGKYICNGLHLRLNLPLETSNRQGHLNHCSCLCPPVWPHPCRKEQLLWQAPSSSCRNSYPRDPYTFSWLEWSRWQIQCWIWGSAWQTWLGHKKYWGREITGVCHVLRPGHWQHLF